jgi:serine/threonine protein kinase/thioredoxin-like negative regulator of GroEL
MPSETLRMPVQELTTGATFGGRYQIIEELGKGGMGKVYKVFDAKIQEKVALKLIRPEVAADPETIERFSNELKLARRVRHENVCGMFDLGEWEGAHFITMEYVSGEDLKSFIRRSRHLTVETAVGIAREICLGLAAAHKLGVIHRDLKPGNIMIDRDGNARIMDFGIARSLKAKGITGAGMMIGTPEYMSPEQAEGKEVEQRSDIYSLGVILFEMLTGRVPFEGETPLGVAIKHKTEMPPDPRKLNPQIPESLSQLILRSMEKDRAKRYQSADEMLADLGKIESGLPTTAREAPKRKPFTSKEITVKFNVKKLFVPLAAIILLAIAAIVALRFIPRKGGDSPSPGIPSLAILYFKNNTGDPQMDFWRSALAESLITDISQSKYIRVLSWDEVYGTLKDLNLLEAQSFTTEDLKKVAENGQAEYVLQGSLSRAGDKFRIETTLRQIKSGQASAPETARVEGTGEQSIYTMVDELTKKTKESLKLTREQIAGDIDYEIGQVTTSSPEAYKYFQQGFELQKKARFKEAVPLYKKALEIDPEFALAYCFLSQASSGTGVPPPESRMYIEKALALSGRLPDRERWRIEASYYSWSEESWGRSIEALTRLLSLYPWDFDAANDLGIHYYNEEEPGKAIEVFENVLKYYPVPKFEMFLGNLAAFYCLAGEFMKAEKILEDYLTEVGENGTVRLYLSTVYLHQGRFEAAIAQADKAVQADPAMKSDVIYRGRAFQAMGNWSAAEKEYPKNVGKENSGPSLTARGALAGLFSERGQFRKAIGILEEALKPKGVAVTPEFRSSASRHFFRLGYAYLSAREHDKAADEYSDLVSLSIEGGFLWDQRMAIWLRGLAFLGKRSLAEAQKAVVELESLVAKSQNKRQATRLLYHLTGCLALEKGDFHRAIEYLEKAKSLLPGRFSLGGTPYTSAHPIFLFPLGEAFYGAGDFEKATAEFEAVSRVIYDRLFNGDLWALSFYRLGQIAEKQGRKADAIVNYQRFLEIWKDADPDRPEPPDARKRLAALT